MNSIALLNTVLPLPSSQLERGGLVGIDREFPHLKFFGRDRLFAALRESDLVEQPIGAGLIGDVFGAVGEQHVAHQPVPVPVRGAGELIESRLVEGSCSSWRCLLVLVLGCIC